MSRQCRDELRRSDQYNDRLVSNINPDVSARKEEFFCQGYAALDGFLNERECAEIRSAVECLRLAPFHAGCNRPHNTLLPLRWNDQIVQLVVRSTRRVRDLSDAVSADDLKWTSGYVSTKEAHSPALWWHQDWWCWDHPISYQQAAAQVAVLCYLTDADRHNGGLRILPGSHAKSAPIHALLPEAHGEDADGLESGHPAMSDLDGQVTMNVRAGGAVVIDYRLLHGTHPNDSNARRDCILLSFTPSWRSLPEDVRAHLIDHPAQPSANEIPSDEMTKLLPHFAGLRRSLDLNRNAPREFEIGS